MTGSSSAIRSRGGSGSCGRRCAGNGAHHGSASAGKAYQPEKRRRRASPPSADPRPSAASRWSSTQEIIGSGLDRELTGIAGYNCDPLAAAAGLKRVRVIPDLHQLAISRADRKHLGASSPRLQQTASYPSSRRDEPAEPFSSSERLREPYSRRWRAGGSSDSRAGPGGAGARRCRRRAGLEESRSQLRVINFAPISVKIDHTQGFRPGASASPWLAPVTCI